MGKRGRPRFVFDENKLADIFELASEGATCKEICEGLGCCEATFYTSQDAMEAFHRGQAQMKLSLRHYQFLQAKAGNVSMLIWLGRNLLGQKEQPITQEQLQQEDDALTKSLERIGEILDDRADE